MLFLQAIWTSLAKSLVLAEHKATACGDLDVFSAPPHYCKTFGVLKSTYKDPSIKRSNIKSIKREPRHFQEMRAERREGTRWFCLQPGALTLHSGPDPGAHGYLGLGLSIIHQVLPQASVSQQAHGESLQVSQLSQPLVSVGLRVAEQLTSPRSFHPPAHRHHHSALPC